MAPAVATQKRLRLAGVHEISGEGHDDLGGQRNTGGFDAHEQGDTGVSAGRDNRNDEAGKDGYDFFRHKGRRCSIAGEVPATSEGDLFLG